jgi:hypothetical protein
VNIVILTGTKEERAEIIANRLITQDFEVCITSYEICLVEKFAFKIFGFEYIVIDEAHRIKNVDPLLLSSLPLRWHGLSVSSSPLILYLTTVLQEPGPPYTTNEHPTKTQKRW